jgi:phenylacetate-CoA ligase
MSNEQLVRIQTELLRETINHAFHKVPFYHRLYEEAQVDMDTVMNLNSIARLPIIARLDFGNTPLLERTSIDTDVNRCVVNSSSGSTGIPIRILEDPYSAAYRDALMLRFLWAYGVRPFDKIARGRYLNASLRSKRLNEKPGLWSFIRGKMIIQPFFTNFDDQLELLSKTKPDVLIALTSYCKGLARHCESVGKSLKFRIVVTSGELLDPVTRRLIENVFQAEVYDHYGLEEVGGSVAWECPTHSGYHINSESLVLEFLRDGKPVSAGDFGELCVTCFQTKATPVLRYSTGDIAKHVEDRCPCGRGLPMMAEIQGRVLDYILTRNYRHVSPYVVMRVLENINGVKQYKVTQNEDLSIEIRIVSRMKDVEPVLKNVQQRCKELFDETPLEIMSVYKINALGNKRGNIESHATG